MIHAPTSGPIGLQPHGSVFKMISRDSATLAIGDVVGLSFSHSSPVAAFSMAPANDAALRASPLACVVKTDSAAMDYGFIGVVVDIGSEGGLPNTEVSVQFGGIVMAKCQCDTSNAISLGQKLCINDDDNFKGTLTNVGSTSVTETVPSIAVAFGTLTANTSGLVPVLMPSDLCFGGVIA